MQSEFANLPFSGTLEMVPVQLSKPMQTNNLCKWKALNLKTLYEIRRASAIRDFGGLLRSAVCVPDHVT